MGIQRKVSYSLVVMVGVVILLTAMAGYDNLTLWWQYIIIMFVISVTVLPPLMWIFTCAALTKVATALADDIEKVINEKEGTRNLMGCNMMEGHKYFKGLCHLCIIDSNTQTEDSSQTAVPFCHNIWLHAPGYSNPEAQLKFKEA